MTSPVTRWQILSKDPERSASFYETVFGWTIDPPDSMGSRLIRTGDPRGIDGGIWPSPPEGHVFVQLFIEVDDVDATLATIEKNGGRVIFTPQDLASGERVAIAHDAEGIPLGLVGRT